ncbi:MAG: hypothetical protein ABWZ39_10780 [Pseudomonas caspiana]
MWYALSTTLPLAIARRPLRGSPFLYELAAAAGVAFGQFPGAGNVSQINNPESAVHFAPCADEAFSVDEPQHDWPHNLIFRVQVFDCQIDNWLALNSVYQSLDACLTGEH